MYIDIGFPCAFGTAPIWQLLNSPISSGQTYAIYRIINESPPQYTLHKENFQLHIVAQFNRTEFITVHWCNEMKHNIWIAHNYVFLTTQTDTVGSFYYPFMTQGINTEYGKTVETSMRRTGYMSQWHSGCDKHSPYIYVLYTWVTAIQIW